MSENITIFVVEDDKFYNEFLTYHLQLMPEYQVRQFFSAGELLQNLNERPDIITLDYGLPDLDGSELLKRIRNFDPEIQVIVVSGQEDIRTALKLIREGAYDYIVKGDDIRDVLLKTVSNIRRNIELRRENEALKRELGKKYNFRQSIIGNSEIIQEVFRKIEKAAGSSITVSISGETGTGKELVAKAIHYASSRGKNSFVAVNVAAIPSELLESELFGHEKGAFTGATNRRIGKFEAADNGTLFLDEISELDLNLQVKLLRAIQEKEITRIGSNSVIRINPRFIVATHKNLLEEVKKGTFRQDLYYRLLGLPIHLPPLRERSNDILLIATSLIEQFCRDNGWPEKKLSRVAKEKLLQYKFPGNVRELRAVIELAVVMSEGESIDAGDLRFETSLAETGISISGTTLKDYTRALIQQYLDKNNYDILKVASLLDIGKSTIYNMIRNKELYVP